jgi:hypothetical protein
MLEKRKRWKMLLQFKKWGWWADFGIGYNDCINKVDTYCKLIEHEKEI